MIDIYNIYLCTLSRLGRLGWVVCEYGDMCAYSIDCRVFKIK